MTLRDLRPPNARVCSDALGIHIGAWRKAMRGMRALKWEHLPKVLGLFHPTQEVQVIREFAVSHGHYRVPVDLLTKLEREMVERLVKTCLEREAKKAEEALWG